MNCIKCQSDKAEKSRQEYSTPIGKMSLVILECGHVINTIEPKFESSDGKKLYPFQEIGVDFLNSSLVSGRGKLIADEQGLGKTIQGLCYLKNKLDRLPCLIICKSKLTRQWMGEVYKWNGSLSLLISGKGIIAGFKYYIVSVDLLRNLDSKEIKRLGIKTIIIDECQSIKNMDSRRTQEVLNLCKPTGTCTCSHSVKDHSLELIEAFDSTKYHKPKECLTCECKEYKDEMDLFIIGMSGTPILNRVSEYFPILHLLDSSRFPSESSFTYNWVDSYWDGFKMKTGGIRNTEAWKEYTSDLIIRRERSEVMPDLPSIDRQITWVDLSKAAQEEYDKQEKGFIDTYIESQLEGKNETTNLLAYISRMRHIIGRSKVPDCVDYVTDFLMSTGRKLCIFVHHKAVGENLTNHLNKWMKDGGYPEVLNIRGNMNPDELGEIQRKFNTQEEYKILVASTLAAGEGLNLQEQCGDCVILERQWNPAKEEQAISRFVRIGFMKSAKVKLNSVIAQYILAIGTIDDWLTSLIEEKRSIFEQAVNAKDIEAAEMDLMKELMSKIVNEGRKKWKLT